MRGQAVTHHAARINLKQTMQNNAPIQLIALDLDGTLLDSNGRISPQNESAIKKALRQGIQVIIATGKTRWSAEAAIAQLGLQSPGVFTQGLTIYDADGALLHETTVPQETAVSILTYLEAQQIHHLAYCSDQLRTPYHHAYSVLLHTKYHEPLPIVVGPLSEALPHFHINKLLISDEANNDATRAELARLFGAQATVTQAVQEYIEVLPLGTSKGRGLRWLLNELGVAETAVLAVGDGENDIEMLQLAGVGVAMGNATDHVKAAADVIVGSNNESGVAEAIKRCVLNGRA
jgi:Cof subfamily protein (haloacid dehalogenase superfamily)